MSVRLRYVGWAAAVVVLAAAGCQRTPAVRSADSSNSASTSADAPQPPPPASGVAIPHRPPAPDGTSDPTPTKAPDRYEALDVPTGWGPTEGEWLAARKAVAGMGDRELAGQVIVAQYTGTGAPTSLVARYHLGGVIVFSDNITSTSALVAANEKLQAASHRGWPLVVATDQEGGIVQRIGPPLTQFPTFMSYGAARDPGLTSRAAEASGDELRAAGFTMVFAPDADVTIGPTDPTIGSRSAGGNPGAVATQVVAAEAGYRRSGIVSVIKHFPGHGSVTTDSHEALPVQHRSLAALAANDFVPFAAAVRAGASAVMVGHIALAAVDPGVPADLSRRDVSLLSSRLGFRGLVTTDALDMGAVTDTTSSGNAAVDALQAGVDMVLMPADTGAAYAGILGAMRDGTLPRSRVRDAAAKVVALMMHEQAQRPPAASSIGADGALSQRVSAEAVTLVSGACRSRYVGSTVTPRGDAASVAAFTRAAEAVGLTVGPGGTTVALVGYGYGPAAADVVVSLDTPYVLAASKASVAELALFGSTAGAMRALVAVLVGKATARGHLPVSVQGLHQQRAC